MTRVMVLNPSYNGNGKQTISLTVCSNQKEVRQALADYRNSNTDMVLYNNVSDVLSGGLYGYVRGKSVCIVTI